MWVICARIHSSLHRVWDVCILLQTSMTQLDECLAAFQEPKPLPASLMWEIDRVHMRNRLPVFSSYDVGLD